MCMLYVDKYWFKHCTYIMQLYVLKGNICCIGEARSASAADISVIWAVFKAWYL